jgi:hypothetical protein
MSIIRLRAHHSPSPRNFYILLQSSFVLLFYVILIVFHYFHQSCNMLMFLVVLDNFLTDVHLFLVDVVLLFYGGLLMFYALSSSLLYNLVFFHCKGFFFLFANVCVFPYYSWWFLTPCWSCWSWCSLFSQLF